MAVVKSILKLTNFEAVIKVAGKGLYKGIDDFSTINLRGDMYDPATELLEDGQVVRINNLQWSGDIGTSYTIVRGGNTIVTLTAENGNFIDFNELFAPDMNNLTDDITVYIRNAVTGLPAQGELWLKLKKVSGYKQKYTEMTTQGITTELDDLVLSEVDDTLTTEN